MSRLPSSPVSLLVLASLSWGLSTALSKVAVEQLTSIDLFGIEVTTGALCLGAAALARGARPSRPSAAVLALGVLEPGIAYLLFDIGIAHTAATHGALLLSTDSVFTIALAAALLGERVDRRLAFALAAGVAGSVLVSLHGGGGSMSSAFGDLLVVGASLGAAGYGVLAKRVAPGRDALSLTAVQMLVAAAIGVPLAAAAAAGHHSHLAHVGAGHLLAALAVGVFASVVPFLLFYAAIDRVTASVAGLVLTLVPLFGTAASVLLLSERLGAVQVAGGGFVVLAAGLAATTVEREPCPA